MLFFMACCFLCNFISSHTHTQVPNGDGLLAFICIHNNGNFVSSFLSQDICRPFWDVSTSTKTTLEAVDQDVPLCWTESPRELIVYPRDDDPECLYVVDFNNTTKHIREISLNWLISSNSKVQDTTTVRNVTVSSLCASIVWSRYVGSLLQYIPKHHRVSRVMIAPRFDRYVVDKLMSTTNTTTSREDDTKPIRDLLGEIQRFTFTELVVEDGNQEEILQHLFRCYRICSEFRDSLRKLGMMVGSERVGEEDSSVVSTQVVKRLVEAKTRLDDVQQRIETFKTRNNETVQRLIRLRNQSNEASRKAKRMLKVLDAINSIPSDAELEFQREITKTGVETLQRLKPRVSLLKTQSRLVRDALKLREDEDNSGVKMSEEQRVFCEETLVETSEMLGSIREMLIRSGTTT